jgi:beta-N-acetylhexosaminidase
MTKPWKQAIEQKLMLAFRGMEPPQAVLTLLAERNIAGFTFFRPFNFQSPAQVRALTGDLQRASAEAGHASLLIAVDQEGGQLNALGEGTTQFPGNMALGATGDTALTQKVGEAIGKELRAMGININYAPVCDLSTNPDNPGLGVRSFGDNSKWVAEMCAAMVTGLQSAGVAASLKHFPGAGESNVDSHHSMPIINHSRERFETVELPPFQAAVDAGAKMIMSGHFAVPALAGRTDIPATLSRAVMNDFVRMEMRFSGVMITDALDMKAIPQGEGQVDAVVTAMRAGVDLMLLTADWEAQERVYNGLIQAYKDGKLGDHHLDSSNERIAALKIWLAQFEQPGLEVVGCAQHQTLAQEVAERSLTLVRDDANLLPLKLPENACIMVVIPEPKDLTPADTSSYEVPSLAKALRQYHAQVDEFILTHSPTDQEIADISSRVASYDLVVAGTISASMNLRQASLVQGILERGVPTITVSLRTPYDLTVYPQAETNICTYSILPHSMNALAAALWGKIPFRGKLPTPIPGMYDRGFGLTSGKEKVV